MIVGVAMVRDEADIIGHIVNHLRAQHVDHLIVADNLSTDDTRPILESFGDYVTVVEDNELGYYQAEKMTKLAQQAENMGADWIVPFDADEWFYSPLGPLGDVLRPISADVIKVWGWDHLPQPWPTFFADGCSEDEGWRFVHRFAYRRKDTQRLPKVVFRSGADFRLHMGNHDVDRAGRREDGSGLIEYRHFGYRSLEQMTRKLRNGRDAYEATTLPAMYGTHWREGGKLTDQQMAERWDQLCNERGLVRDPAPWP